MLQTISNPTPSAFSHAHQNNSKQAKRSCRHNFTLYFHRLSLHHSSHSIRKVHFSSQVTICDRKKNILLPTNLHNGPSHINVVKALKIKTIQENDKATKEQIHAACHDIIEYKELDPAYLVHKFKKQFSAKYEQIADLERHVIVTATSIFESTIDKVLQQADYCSDFAMFMQKVAKEMSEQFCLEVDRPRTDIHEDAEQEETFILYGYTAQAKEALQEILESYPWQKWVAIAHHLKSVS